MELIAVLLLVLCLLVAIKIIGWILKTGIFVITLPFKLIFGAIGIIISLILLPLLAVPVLLVVLIPLIPFIVVGLVIFLLLKYAF